MHIYRNLKIQVCSNVDYTVLRLYRAQVFL